MYISRENLEINKKLSEHLTQAIDQHVIEDYIQIHKTLTT